MSRADTFSKKLPNTDMVDFRTPDYLWDFIKTRWNPQYDAACTPGLNNLAKPLRLEEDWPNGVIYSNPPFDTPSIIKWALKGFEHSRKAEGNIHVMLIPNKLNVVLLQKECSHTFDKLIFLGGRVDFPSPYAVKGGASRNGSVLVIQNVMYSSLTIYPLPKDNEYILLSKLKGRFK